MKKLSLLLLLLALVVSTSAQANLNFADLPDARVPTPMPAGYGDLNWTAVSYVNPLEWSGAGPGFKNQQYIAGTDVAFGGGLCLGSACASSLSWPFGFQVVSADVAAGYTSNSITVIAYNKGKFVGSQVYHLTTQVQTIAFPIQWDVITQLVIQPQLGRFVRSLRPEALHTGRVSTRASMSAGSGTAAGAAPVAPIRAVGNGIGIGMKQAHIQACPVRIGLGPLEHEDRV